MPLLPNQSNELWYDDAFYLTKASNLRIGLELLSVAPWQPAISWPEASPARMPLSLDRYIELKEKAAKCQKPPLYMKWVAVSLSGTFHGRRGLRLRFKPRIYLGCTSSCHFVTLMLKCYSTQKNIHAQVGLKEKNVCQSSIIISLAP